MQPPVAGGGPSAVPLMDVVSQSSAKVSHHHHSTQVEHRRKHNQTTTSAAAATSTTTTAMGLDKTSYYYPHHQDNNNNNTGTDYASNETAAAATKATSAGEPYRRAHGGARSSLYGIVSPYSSAHTSSSATVAASSASAAAAATATSTSTLLGQQGQKNAIRVMTVLGPTISCVLYSTESSFPLVIFLFVSLVLYGLDLANERDYILPMMWLAVPLVTLSCGWFWIMELDDTTSQTNHYSRQQLHPGQHGRRADDMDSGWTALEVIFQTFTAALLFTCLASWCSLQLDWLQVKYQHVCRQLESTVYGLTPLVCAALITNQLLSNSSWVIRTSGHVHHHHLFHHDTIALLAPFCFATVLTLLMLTVGTCPASSPTTTVITDKVVVDVHDRCPQPPIGLQRHEEGSLPSKNGDGRGGLLYAIPPTVAYVHVVVLAVTPPTMHIATNLGRLISPHASMDDVYDCILAFAVPYGLLMIISALHHSNICQSPYGQLSLLSNAGSYASISTVLIRLLVTMIIAWSFQQRYMIPAAHWFSFHFMGNKVPTWLLSLYGMLATLSMAAAVWLWGRRSTLPSSSFLGEYHEDIVQLCLAAAGMSLGKAFGMAWNLTPLPVLALLGLSVWLLTRMLRYLAIFLFVVHATGLVVFTYRFAGITDQFMQLPGLPSYAKLTLTQFGMLIIASSIVIGLVAGLGVRSTGGFLARPMKRWDVTGWILVAYALILIELEIALLKRPYPVKELAGIQPDEVADEEMSVSLYDPVWSFLTSMVLVALSQFMKRVRIISARTAWVVLSLAVGKAIAVYIDLAAYMSPATTTTTSTTTSADAPTADTGTDVLVLTMIASLVCIILIAPRVVLQPVRIKTSTRYKNYLSGGPDLPVSTTRTILVYAFLFLPLAVAVAVPFVIAPLAQILAARYGGDVEYYHVSTPVSEFIGPAVALWGLACLSMLNHLLPDGGGEVWKRLAALAFVSGILLYLVAPTLGFNVGDAASSPYASVSSLGSQLLRRSKSRTGGWGLLSASVATLLAVLGPLELKEKRRLSGPKDQSVLLRTLIFSLLFGGGVAWFITVQNMNEVEWVYLLLTMIAAMAMAFLGTVAAVCGHFLELDNMDEVAQLIRMWTFSFPAFLIVCAVPQVVMPPSASVHPFGIGGWLTTYLCICCITTLAFAASLRLRPDKDPNTRGIANASCIFSWLCAVSIVLGRYGVAGLNDTSTAMTTVFGIAAPVLGTVLVAPILLVLEGESSPRGSTRRISSGHKVRTVISWGLHLPQLKRANRFAPLFLGTALILLCASLYAILVRGSGLFPIPAGSLILSYPEDSTTATRKADHELAVLAAKAVFHNHALELSARLAGASIWTTKNLVGPVLHLIGVISTLPNLYLCTRRWWWPPFGGAGDGSRPGAVSTAQIYFALPLNTIPLLLCRGIPCLWAAAFLSASGGCLQLLLRWQVDRESRMQI